MVLDLVVADVRLPGIVIVIGLLFVCRRHIQQLPLLRCDVIAENRWVVIIGRCRADPRLQGYRKKDFPGFFTDGDPLIVSGIAVIDLAAFKSRGLVVDRVPVSAE